MQDLIELEDRMAEAEARALTIEEALERLRQVDYEMATMPIGGKQ